MRGCQLTVAIIATTASNPVMANGRRKKPRWRADKLFWLAAVSMLVNRSIRITVIQFFFNHDLRNRFCRNQDAIGMEVHRMHVRDKAITATRYRYQKARLRGLLAQSLRTAEIFTVRFDSSGWPNQVIRVSSLLRSCPLLHQRRSRSAFE